MDPAHRRGRDGRSLHVHLQAAAETVDQAD